MSQNLLNHKPLIEVLEANRLLRSPDEVAQFEETLETLAQNPDPADLPSLHLILDDACEQSEVMFSLVHFLESFDVQDQIQAFIQVMPDLVKRAPEWTAILHSRIMNEEIGRSVFEEAMQAINNHQQSEIHQLLLLASTKLSSTQRTKVA
jgi:Immunity protein 30